jgi:hypothetical protein
MSKYTKHAAQGYMSGSKVIQYRDKQKISFDTAIIEKVYDNGALDVIMNGQTYGWSVRTCEVLSTPYITDDELSQIIAAAQTKRVEKFTPTE